MLLWVALAVIGIGLAAALGSGATYLVGMLRSPHESGATPRQRPPELTAGGDLIADCVEWERLACSCPLEEYRRRNCDEARDTMRQSESQFHNCAQRVAAARQSCPAPNPADDMAPVTQLPLPPATGIPECDSLGELACTCGSNSGLSNRCARARTFLVDHREEPPSEVGHACRAEAVIIQRLCDQEVRSANAP